MSQMRVSSSATKDTCVAMISWGEVPGSNTLSHSLTKKLAILRNFRSYIPAIFGTNQLDGRVLGYDKKKRPSLFFFI